MFPAGLDLETPGVAEREVERVREGWRGRCEHVDLSPFRGPHDAIHRLTPWLGYHKVKLIDFFCFFFIYIFSSSTFLLHFLRK
jgi:hypothetical protein